jgi:hypothetical protein
VFTEVFDEKRRCGLLDYAACPKSNQTAKEGSVGTIEGQKRSEQGEE